MFTYFWNGKFILFAEKWSLNKMSFIFGWSWTQRIQKGTFSFMRIKQCSLESWCFIHEISCLLLRASKPFGEWLSNNDWITHGTCRRFSWILYSINSAVLVCVWCFSLCYRLIQTSCCLYTWSWTSWPLGWKCSLLVFLRKFWKQFYWLWNFKTSFGYLSITFEFCQIVISNSWWFLSWGFKSFGPENSSIFSWSLQYFLSILNMLDWYIWNKRI